MGIHEQKERISKVRTEHKKACKLCMVSLVALGIILSYMGMHEIGIPAEIAGIFMAELI